MSTTATLSAAAINPLSSLSLRNWGKPPTKQQLAHENIVIECGWGRLIFGHSFRNNAELAEALHSERHGYRDLAIYLRDPQVLVAHAPHELFIDPSYTYRLMLAGPAIASSEYESFCIRPLEDKDIPAVHCIYHSRQMVVPDEAILRAQPDCITYWVAESTHDNAILGVGMSLDHKLAFDDPENGASIWAVAVDPQATHPGVGQSLVEHTIAHFREKGRAFLDVSVLHNNASAIMLYEKLGFQRVPVFCVKNKTAINEPLYTAPQPDEEKLNPYSLIIINEAKRRGIRVNVLDPVDNYFRLDFGGRSIVCRESLSELTSSIAMSRCSDKATTTRIFRHAGLTTPAQQVAASPAENHAFLDQWKTLVVKPAVGEQGAGITMDVTTRAELALAIEAAQKVHDRVLLEAMVPGIDLRVVMIDYEVVAAAIRKPPCIVGDGQHTVLELIQKQSRRREKATQGESRIPIDNELKRTITHAGYQLDDILPANESLVVRRTANLHTGGTIHDVTAMLHPTLEEVSRQAVRALDIPVAGLDLIVTSPSDPEYVLIEANERPGLANHEPQPTAERFIDMLFPQSSPPLRGGRP